MIDSVDLTGSFVGRYEIRARLGAGGMGEVYRAMDTQLHRQVALKRVGPHYRNDPKYGQHLLNEARRASALNDSHVAGIHDVFEHEQELFVVMEFVDGLTIRERMMEGPIETPEFLRLATQCVQGLAAAHDKGIVHGDLKPENVMVSRVTGEVKLCDFGLAQQMFRPEDVETATTRVAEPLGAFGTAAYMAPEILAGGAVSALADIFSLGVTFYEMLAGKNPFRAQNLASSAQRIIAETPPPLGSAVPAEVSAVIFKMMSKDHTQRYQHASELLVAFEKLTSVREASAPQGRKLLIPAAILLGMLAIVVGVFWNSRSVAPPATTARNLVVLPFETVGSQVQRFQSEGLSETLNAALVKVSTGRNLSVLPTHDVRVGHVKTVEDARQELGATLILKGSVQYSDQMVRVSVVLIDGTTHAQLSAETITADASDPFGLQDRIVEKTVGMLGIQLQNTDQASIQQHGTLQPGAYEFYLQGRGYLLNFDRVENLDSAIELFRRALTADPGYSLAYAGLGEALWRRFESSKDNTFVDPARTACENAVSLGPKVPAAHLCLGTVFNGTGEYQRAVSEFDRSLELDPTLDVAYMNLGTAYDKLGRSKEAESTYLRAIKMKPQYWATYNALGGYYYKKGRYDQAQQMFQQVVTLAPDSYRGFSNLGAMYQLQGRRSEAIREYEKSLKIRPFYAAASNLGTLRFYEGDYAGAARAFRQAVDLDAHD